MKKKTFQPMFLIVVLLFCGIDVCADTPTRASNIKSSGVINLTKDGKTAVVDTSDLTYLANEIDSLESTYKSELVSAVNSVGANLTGAATSYTLAQLVTAIKDSQKITGTYTAKDGTSQTLAGATAANLPLGTAAWVNGSYVIGTGEDLDNAVEIAKNEMIARTVLIGAYSCNCWNDTATIGKQTLSAGTYIIKAWRKVTETMNGYEAWAKLYINGVVSESGTYTFDTDTEIYYKGYTMSAKQDMNLVIIQID